MSSDAPEIAVLDSLKDSYRSGVDSLGRDFFAPCLGACSAYWRAAGYFSSSALVYWIGAIVRSLQGSRIDLRVLASPQLSEVDLSALRKATSASDGSGLRSEVIASLVRDVEAIAGEASTQGVCAQIFAWLVANKRMEIRFAFPDHLEDANIFHEKYGVFEFPGEIRVAFTGSANETFGGHVRNYESIDVYRSWLTAEAGRVTGKAAQFEEAWSNKASGLKVEVLSDSLLERIRTISPQEMPRLEEDGSRAGIVTGTPAWPHQLKAKALFLEKKAGILEMATGTGKTKTAMMIMEDLLRREEISSAIVCADGNDLLEQWASEFDRTRWVDQSGLVVFRQFGGSHQLGDYALGPANSVLVLSRSQLPQLFRRLKTEDRGKALVVHDEVHGLGVPSLRERCSGEHAEFPYRLGLSATPERAYDQAGNDFIEAEIGETIFCFPLERAISAGILCEFDYVPLDYELTENDRERIKAVYRKQAARKKQGNPMSAEEVWTDIARVYKTAEQKPEVFFQYLTKHPEVLNSCIIFVETMEYGNALLETIHKYTTRYRTYYADADRENLLAFARGDIDCLITCHRLSQGIDLPSLQNVVLFASARSKLETIQRIGRCLRRDPAASAKRAKVVDFVRSSASELPNADDERCAWLSELAKTRKEPERGT